MLSVDRSLLLIVATMSSVSWALTSSTLSGSSGARRDQEPLALRPGPPGYPRPQDHRKSPDDRKKLETELLIGIQSEILRRLRLPHNRTNVRGVELGSGTDEMGNRTMELLRMMEDKERRNEEVREQLDRRDNNTVHGKTHRAVLKTVLFGEKVSNLTDDSVIQFKLNQNPNRDLVVTAATVTVLVRPERPSTGSSNNHKPEAVRLNIRIYALDDNDTTPTGNPLTEVSILARRARAQRLLLPTSYVQGALDSQEGVLRLKIVCDNCGVDEGGDPDSEEVRRSRKKGQPHPRSLSGGKNRLRAQRNLQNTPYLTINSKKKPAATRARGRMQAARGSGK